MKRALLPRFALLALLTLALLGCGTRFFYDRIDTALYLYLSSHVSLHDEQAGALKAALRDFHAWHRETALPDYAQFLDALADATAQPAGLQGIDEALAGLEALWRDTVAGVAPAAARWLAGLGPEQRDEFFASLAESDVELHEEYCDISEDERRRNREDAVIAAMRDWVGRLDTLQRALVRERLARLDANGCDWIDNRARFRARLRQLVDTHATDPHYEENLARLLVQPEAGWDPAYRARYETNRDIVVQMLADLDQLLSDRQRATLTGKLHSYARDFRALNASAVPAP